jgi:hypothetical protein
MGVMVLGVDSQTATCDIFGDMFKSPEIDFVVGASNYIIYGDFIGMIEH